MVHRDHGDVGPRRRETEGGLGRNGALDEDLDTGALEALTRPYDAGLDRALLLGPDEAPFPRVRVERGHGEASPCSELGDEAPRPVDGARDLVRGDRGRDVGEREVRRDERRREAVGPERHRHLGSIEALGEVLGVTAERARPLRARSGDRVLGDRARDERVGDARRHEIGGSVDPCELRSPRGAARSSWNAVGGAERDPGRFVDEDRLLIRTVKGLARILDTRESARIDLPDTRGGLQRPEVADEQDPRA